MENQQYIVTLESEIKAFANELPYWQKYLADKILSCNIISNIEIDFAYALLLEDLALKVETDKSDIFIDYIGANVGNYKLDLLFTKLENVEGVNALTENQVIEFCPNLTIIYGANGSGKSSYVRLLKKVFYSKTPEEIFQNIQIISGHKPVSANFTFHSAGSDILLNFPENYGNSEFEQFAVFDIGSVIHHLDRKNEFEFRPAGLNFFAEFTEAIKKVEAKLTSEIASRQTPNEFSNWFDGESEIKTFIQNLSAQIGNDDLDKYKPFTAQDKEDKNNIEKQFDELSLTLRDKEKEIQKMEGIKVSLINNKKNIETINTYFTSEHLTHISNLITDLIEKEAIAKAEGLENFKADKIQNIGSVEWKNFIVAAEKFANQQNKGEYNYPNTDSNCLLCHQPLLEDAQNLIKNYWKFIKSAAEQNVLQAQKKLDDIKGYFEKLHFDLYPGENTLSVWLTENHPQVLVALKKELLDQKTLAENILTDISEKSPNSRVEIKISVMDHEKIIFAIDESIKTLKEDEQSKELKTLQETKTFLVHKEKFNIHLDRFTNFIDNQKWIAKASSISWMSLKRNITDKEKYLTSKYFNQKYIDTFNNECKVLNGNFGIEVSHTGAAGTSFKQLTIKGNSPAAILSEGEQKVIALADFLSEMQLLEINRGIIFDDPVTSLDESRKRDIAQRLVTESLKKQVIVFTHDLIFVSNLITISEDNNSSFVCHWIENREGYPGQVWLHNSPSYEKEYRNAEPVKKYYTEANRADCPPVQREFLVKTGFTALRTCYEVLVINDLFKNVVQRYNERVSLDSLSSVYFDESLVNELLDSFAQCCRYMEGHTHSDKYAYKKPDPINLNDEIQRYEAMRTKIRKTKKPSP